MNPAISPLAVDAVITFVVSRGDAGATASEVARTVFDEAKCGATTGHTYALQILKVAAALGHLRSEKDCDGVNVYFAHDEPTTVESIAITPRFLWLMIHIIEYGIKHGTLGNPATHALLEHLKRERERIDAPARAEGTGT